MEIQKGDTVQQVAPLGMTTHRLPGYYIVRKVERRKGKVVLASKMERTIVTDERGKPRHLPARVFRRVSL